MRFNSVHWPPATRHAIIALAIVLACAAAVAEGPRYGPTVRAIPVKVEQTSRDGSGMDFHYCIYFGDEESTRIDNNAGRAHSQQTLLLLHPVEEAASRMAVQVPHRWYAIRQTADGFSTHGLFTDPIWRSVPCMVRHVLVALGVDDPDLILISCQFLSGSVSVYYHPRFDRDRAFYEQKLQRLRLYLAAHDLREEIPVGRAVRGYEDLVRTVPAVTAPALLRGPWGSASRQGGASRA